MLNLSEQCPSCNSTNLVENIQPPDGTHYAKLTCGNCGHFLKWLPKPRVPEISIARLLHGTGLEPWERKFLKAIACRTPTKAEVIVIEAIQTKVNPDRTGQGVKLC
jgi:hypothetical protein